MKLNNFLVISLILLLFPIALAEVNDYAPVKQNDCLLLKQTCASCTFVNVSVTYKNQTLLDNQEMTKSGSLWTYSFCNTSDLGRYDVSGYGDLEGTDTGFDILYFEVTPSGNSGTNNLVFILFIIIIIYSISFIVFFGKNEIVTIIGGMFMIALSVYIHNEGIIVFRDYITTYFAYITFGLGAFFSIISSISLIEENV